MNIHEVHRKYPFPWSVHPSTPLEPNTIIYDKNNNCIIVLGFGMFDLGFEIVKTMNARYSDHTIDHVQV